MSDLDHLNDLVHRGYYVIVKYMDGRYYDLITMKYITLAWPLGQ